MGWGGGRQDIDGGLDVPVSSSPVSRPMRHGEKDSWPRPAPRRYGVRGDRPGCRASGDERRRSYWVEG